MVGVGVREEKLQPTVVDTCDLFLALTVGAVTFDGMWFKSATDCLVVARKGRMYSLCVCPFCVCVCGQLGGECVYMYVCVCVCVARKGENVCVHCVCVCVCTQAHTEDCELLLLGEGGDRDRESESERRGGVCTCYAMGRRGQACLSYLRNHFYPALSLPVDHQPSPSLPQGSWSADGQSSK